jgi:hypothetical protein
MSTRDVEFDFAAWLRTEGREAAAGERTHFRDDGPSARTASKPPPQRDSGRLSRQPDEGSDDHNGNTQRGPDQIVIDHRALEDWIFGSEQVAVPLPCDAPSTPRPVDASLRQRNGQTQVKPLPPKFEQLFDIATVQLAAYAGVAAPQKSLDRRTHLDGGHDSYNAGALLCPETF